MASDSSPHNVCGQILFSLKMSKLNYVVKETPFSAYVTIRQKILTIFLKEKNRDLETKLGLITFELEETQVKNEALEKEDEKLEDSIEEVLTEKRTVTKDMNKLSEEHFKLKSDLAEVTKANDALGKKCLIIRKNVKSLSILENNLNTKFKELVLYL